jgi:hypothetical protein
MTIVKVKNIIDHMITKRNHIFKLVITPYKTTFLSIIERIGSLEQ